MLLVRHFKPQRFYKIVPIKIKECSCVLDVFIKHLRSLHTANAVYFLVKYISVNLLIFFGNDTIYRHDKKKLKRAKTLEINRINRAPKVSEFRSAEGRTKTGRNRAKDFAKVQYMI